MFFRIYMCVYILFQEKQNSSSSAACLKEETNKLFSSFFWRKQKICHYFWRNKILSHIFIYRSIFIIFSSSWHKLIVFLLSSKSYNFFSLSLFCHIVVANKTTKTTTTMQKMLHSFKWMRKKTCFCERARIEIKKNSTTK